MPVLVLLDELCFSKPKTKVLRCLGQRHRNYALTKGVRFDAVNRDSGALFFTKDKIFIVQQGLADLPKAPLFRKDSLRPEGDVAQATEGGRLAKPSGFD